MLDDTVLVLTAAQGTYDSSISCGFRLTRGWTWLRSFDVDVLKLGLGFARASLFCTRSIGDSGNAGSDEVGRGERTRRWSWSPWSDFWTQRLPS